MKRILVTGGSGFLGSHIADALTSSGYEVTVLDMVPSPYLKPPFQLMTTGSILDTDFLDNVFREGKFDAVYHMAALADLNEARQKPKLSAEVNIIGTINVLEACIKYRVQRFVFGSSVYVYSQLGSFYRCSKQACENYIEEFNKSYGLPFTILRYGSLYGPRSNESNGVYRLLKQAVVKGEIVYHGSGADKREYIHVLDAARLSVEALHEKYSCKHLIITGNDCLTIQDLFTMFGEMLNKKVVVHFKYLDGKESAHYAITPYNFTPKIGMKLTGNEYVDMGQGLLELIQEIFQSISGADENFQS